MFELFLQIFGILSLLFIVTVIAIHLYYWMKRKPMKLNSESFIVIIGSCTGIGKQLALQLAKTYSPHLLLVDYRTDLFESVQKQIEQVSSAQCQTYPCDLSKHRQVQALIHFLNQKGKKINMMIYNAGILIPKRGWEFTDEERHDIFQINFLASIPIFSKTMKLLEGGNFCLTSSFTSLWPGTPTYGAYQATKAAIVMYYTAIRHEMMISKIPITISIAAPGSINTQMLQGLTKKEYASEGMVLSVEKGTQQILKGFIYRKEFNAFPIIGIETIFRLFSLLPSELYINAAWLLNKMADYQSYRERMIRERSEIREKLK